MRFDRFSSPLGEPYIAEIEEIPFYHYLPGETVLVLEVPGCPLHCPYCDRAPLARSLDWSPYEPSRVADTVANLAKEPGFAGIVWDGGEPSLHWDNVMECAHAVHALGRKVGVATNGGVTADLLADTPGTIDMLLVRFKGFAEETYHTLGAAPGILASSQALVEQALSMGVHVELMLDIARQSHQQEQEYADMLKWILQDLRRSIPLHLRAIAPEHGFTIREGPVMPFLENLVESARRQHVGFVYLSNCHGHFFNNTMCPNCYSVVIDRTSSPLDLSFVTDGKCGQCGTDLALTLEKENL